MRQERGLETGRGEDALITAGAQARPGSDPDTDASTHDGSAGTRPAHSLNP